MKKQHLSVVSKASSISCASILIDLEKTSIQG